MVKFLPVILFLFLPGCAPGMGSVGWPVEQYDMAACTMMPMEPSCLSLAGVQGGFKYGGQFNACKQSLQNFIDANERYYNCTSQKLKKIFDDLIKKSTNSYGCLVANYKKSEEDLYKNCSLVSEPEFRQRYEADGIEYNFGIPRCLQKNISLASGMFLEIRLSECKKQLETFSNDGLFAAGLDAASAQKQYDTYTRNLKKKIERNAEDALRRFNCFAERRDFCT